MSIHLVKMKIKNNNKKECWAEKQSSNADLTDFFEIKPLIESNVPGYRFMIRHLDANHMFLEYMLIGIPSID